MKNEILKDVWAAKDSLAAQHHYRVDELFQDLRAREKASGRRYLDLSRPTRKPAMKKKPVLA